MESLLSQSLMATQGMASLSWGILLIELISLVFFGLCCFEFFQLIRRHSALFDAIGIPRDRTVIEWRAWMFFVCYGILTLLITVTTIIFFVFQPHWL